jgi:hypothetical protein
VPLVDQFVAGINLPTMLAAALLVLAVMVLIRIGKTLIMAAVFGSIAGGASLGQGNSPGSAATHAAIGFAVAAVALFFVRFIRQLGTWLLITAAGVAALLLWGMATS